MHLTDWIGYIAAFLTTASFVPQAWHTFQTKDVRGISLGMYSAFTAGVALWLVYGLMLDAWPIVIANAVTLSLAATILVMKLRYHEAGSASAKPRDGARVGRWAVGWVLVVDIALEGRRIHARST